MELTNSRTSMKAADNIRILALSMVECAQSGHPGGAMGGADFITVLYSEFLEFDPSDMGWINRDRFFMDPGHMSAMLYSTLYMFGKYSAEELKNFRQWESPTPGHPEREISRGIENTSGPLGQGHTFAVGAAIAEKFLEARFGNWMVHRIYAYISDGGVQEEISQGAGRLAGFLGLNNLTMFYDSNDIQLSTPTDHVTCEDTAKKYESWGWNVIVVNGNDQDQIRNALTQAKNEKHKPSLILGKTIMGKGALTETGESFERKVSTHGMPLSKAGGSVAKSIENLGGDPADPFKIFPAVKEFFEEVSKRKIEQAKIKKAAQQKWEQSNPELAARLKRYFSGQLPPLDFRSIAQKDGSSTRGASKNVLAYFAEKVDNMIVASADLSNSDNTDGFLKKSKELRKDDFSGAFLQAGVSELTMGAICNGITLHGGVVPVCGTFFVFSDYMKPAARLAALMKLPVKFLWTHDAFRVGEDGPTHQPVEQEAQIRLLEKLKNHSGGNGFLVFRPADAFETSVCWKIALENLDSPTALILSRQNIPAIPARTGSTRYDDALQASRGAYIVMDDGGKPDIILVGNGSEVSTLIAGAAQLKEKKKLRIRVVSAPSEGLFRNQDKKYQAQVLPANVPTFGLTAGLPVTLEGLAGPLGKVFGLDHFGFSAPYEVLDEKFGFTGDNVCQQVLSYLEEYPALKAALQ